MKKYSLKNISKDGEYWEEMRQDDKCGNYYLVDDVDLEIESLKEQTSLLKSQLDIAVDLLKKIEGNDFDGDMNLWAKANEALEKIEQLKMEDENAR